MIVWKFAHILVLVVSSFCLLSCQKRTHAVDFIFLNGAEPQTIDPATLTGQLEGRIAKALFEGLYNYSPDGKVVPGVADSHTVSEDGLNYTFTIRQGVSWSNGEPVTAHDFEASWRRVLEPLTASKYAEILYFIDQAEAYNKGEINDFSLVGCKALDANTFQVRLHTPAAYFLELTAFSTYLPVHIQSVEKYGDAWIKPQHLICNGPFKMKNWFINDKIELEKNEHYWNKNTVRFNRIDALAVNSASTAINMYLTGQVDLILDKNLVPGMLMADLRQRHDIHIYDYLATFFLRFNVTRPHLKDPRVRKALALSVDKQEIVERITRGGEKAAHTLCPPGIPGYPLPEGLNHDPVQARELFAEAGYPDGKGFPRTEILFNKSELNEQIAVEVQSMWKKQLGIDVELRTQEWANYLYSMDHLDYDIARSSWIGDYVDPNTFLDCFVTGRGNNRTGWSHKTYDSLLLEASLTTDVNKRAILFQQAEQILVKESVAVLPVYHYVGVVFYDKERLGGFEPNLLAEHPFQHMYWKDSSQ
ncbi:MAG: peptide ABC transporter substrate-binding protein [Verrucomicrobiota bacterium]